MSGARHARLRAASGGFSLLELLAALAIGSVVLAAIAGLIRNVGLSFEAGTRGVGHAERLLLALERIATDLASTRYVHISGEQGAKAIFNGGAKKLAFISGAGVASGTPGEEIVVLEVEEGSDATRLVRRRAPWLGRAAAAEAKPRDAVVLLEGNLQISFLYSDRSLFWSSELGRQRRSPALRPPGPARPRHRRRRARAAGVRDPLGCAAVLLQARRHALLPGAAARFARLAAEEQSAVTGRDRQRGIILIAVLWSIALLSGLAMAASTTFRSFAGIVTVHRDRLRADALFTAGLEVAAGIIGRLDATPVVELETRLAMPGGDVQIRLGDEGGRIDIGKAPVELLASLFRHLGARDPEGIAQQIAAWRTVDKDQPRATSEEAQAPESEWPFSDVRQLSQIPGMSPELFEAAAPC